MSPCVCVCGGGGGGGMCVCACTLTLQDVHNFMRAECASSVLHLGMPFPVYSTSAHSVPIKMSIRVCVCGGGGGRGVLYYYQTAFK